MEELIIKKLSFTKRPIPLPAEYRPMYKIAVIVMILKYNCRNSMSSLLKLHLFSWALGSKENREGLQSYISNNFVTEFSVWGIEPALNRALQIAVAENICEFIKGKNYKLTEKGNKFFELIVADIELFDVEKYFLSSIGQTSITEKRILLMTQKWKLSYAEN